MIISLENEIKLKNILKGSNKEKDVEDLSKEIEDKESKMLKYISEYYMNIIDKCNDLVEVKNKIPKILDVNESVIASFKDISIQFHEIKKEIDIHKQLETRIKSVICELGKLEDFFKHANNNYERDSLYFYRITTNMLRLGELKKEFVNYSFYDELNEIFVNYKNSVRNEREILYKKWKENVIKNSEANGKSILNLFKTETAEEHISLKSSSTQKLLFPEINKLRSELLTQDLMIVFWIYKKTGRLEDFIDRLNVDRQSMIEGYSGKKYALYSYANEFVLSYFLIQLNRGINPHYDDLVGNLNKYFFDSEIILDLHNTKDILVPFKNVLNYIKVEESVLEQAIGKIAMDFFATHDVTSIDPSEMSKEEFKNALVTFINDSYNFISKIKNNEINEILAKKVDEYLQNYLEVSDDDVEDMNVLVKEVLGYCRERNISYLAQDFASERIINSKFADYKSERVKEIIQVVDELFLNKDKDFNINLQRLCKQNMIIEEELYKIIKTKFTEEQAAVKQETEEEKRTRSSRISCFCNFLKSFNQNFYDDFKDMKEQNG